MSYTSQTTIGTTNPSVYPDPQPTLKKFWLTVEIPYSLVSFFENYTGITSNSYLENLTTEQSYDFKIGLPSIDSFGYDGFMDTYLPANEPSAWPGYGNGVPEIQTHVIYSQGTPVNTTTYPGVYQPAFAWEDGIWHLHTNLVTDYPEAYESDAYFLLTESLDCCMTKYAAKIGSGCTAKALDKMTKMLAYRDMAYKAFDEGDYATTNLMLKKANELCSQTGCNCGCN